MSRFQAGRVDRGSLGAFGQDLGLATEVQHRTENRIGVGLSQQPLGRRTERGEVRDLG